MEIAKKKISWRGSSNNTRHQPGEAVVIILDIGLERR
ncbi:hypothetical protein A2U01_0072795, partial [Trifolium medium]|nr:hypothetical protein [Trifolium medium]